MKFFENGFCYIGLENGFVILDSLGLFHIKGKKHLKLYFSKV
jgi:hypothetical protein